MEGEDETVALNYNRITQMGIPLVPIMDSDELEVVAFNGTMHAFLNVVEEIQPAALLIDVLRRADIDKENDGVPGEHVISLSAIAQIGGLTIAKAETSTYFDQLVDEVEAEKEEEHREQERRYNEMWNEALEFCLESAEFSRAKTQRSKVILVADALPHICELLDENDIKRVVSKVKAMQEVEAAK